MRSGKAELRLGLTPRHVMEAAAADPTVLRRLTATGNIELGSPLGNASVWHGGNSRCSDDLVLVVSKVFRGEAEVCPRLARRRRGLIWFAFVVIVIRRILLSARFRARALHLGPYSRVSGREKSRRVCVCVGGSSSLAERERMPSHSLNEDRFSLSGAAC
jgi:hypothetical protein